MRNKYARPTPHYRSVALIFFLKVFVSKSWLYKLIVKCFHLLLVARHWWDASTRIDQGHCCAPRVFRSANLSHFRLLQLVDAEVRVLRASERSYSHLTFGRDLTFARTWVGPLGPMRKPKRTFQHLSWPKMILGKVVITNRTHLKDHHKKEILL
jgi:hypothetical protein